MAYPIIQGPLGGLASQRLTATVSNVGLTGGNVMEWTHPLYT